MVSKEDRHKCAYQFIYQKLQGSVYTFTQGLVNKELDTNYFSLNDINMLYNCLADPSEGPVAALRIVPRDIATGRETDKHFVRSMQTNSKTRN